MNEIPRFTMLIAPPPEAPSRALPEGGTRAQRGPNPWRVKNDQLRAMLRAAAGDERSASRPEAVTEPAGSGRGDRHCDQPDIGPQRRRAADPFVLPFLQNAEQLRLDRRVRSPISSRKSVPPAATSKRPRLRRSAPVNAPRSCPKSSDSASVSGSAAQLTATNGPSERRLA